MDTHLWYFAYGSNLDPDTFLRRRGMQPFESRVARLDGYRIVFDLPIGPGERAVANVCADAAAVVWGVAYRLSATDAEHLDRTEGVGRGLYRRRSVELVASPTDDRVAAFTYESPSGVVGRKPSARYMGLILRGAHHHGLPPSWIATLAAFELAVDEREGAAGD